MSHLTVTDLLALDLAPTGAPARVLEGEPVTSELVLVERDGLEVGVWEVTPGVFASRKPDVGEVMHFIAGSGAIVHPDGTATTIAPGVVLALTPGWEGTWRVDTTVRKLYTIYGSTSA